MRYIFASKPRFSRKDGIIPIAVIGIAVFLVLAIIWFAVTHLGSGDVSEGRNYIKALEEQDLEKVEATIKEVEMNKLSTRMEALKEELLNGEVDVWSMFGDTAILGDSRAVGFYYHGYVPSERVMAEGGYTIRNVEEYIPTLQTLKPSTVFLSYGLNDVSIGYWKEPDEYAEEYLQVVRNLQKELPNATIFINSGLPARDPAFERMSVWRRIPEFNDAVEEMCKENDIPFIDNSIIAEENTDKWDIDGIHVHKDFYPIWATNMILTVFEYTATHAE